MFARLPIATRRSGSGYHLLPFRPFDREGDAASLSRHDAIGLRVESDIDAVFPENSGYFPCHVLILSTE